MKEEVLRIDNGLVKINGFSILNDIYLQVFAGESLGIIFDNMEEKNALIQLLSGEEKLSYGRLYLNEKLIKGNNSEKLFKKNVFTISETSKLIKTLNIYENIFFTTFNSIFIDSKMYEKMAYELLQNFSIDIPVDKPIRQLSNLERVTIELLKAYTLGCKLVSMSNIASILNNTELGTFFKLVSLLKQTGIAFIIIETFEDIIFEQTNKLAIIKNGKTVGMFDSSQIDRKRIYQLLCKEPLNNNYEKFPTKGNPYLDSKEVVLSFRNVSDEILNSVSFDIRRGEILRILYMDDASKNHLIELLKGKLHAKEGQIYINNKFYLVNSIGEAQTKGVCFVEENATKVMLFKKLSVMYNLCIPLSSKVNLFWLKKKYSQSVIKALNGLIDSSYFKMLISDVPPSILQKIVYCRWLLYAPKVVVCIKPFSITDVKVNQVIEQMINLLADKGIAILIVTSNWPSLSSINGNVLYLENGKLVNK